MSDTAVATPEIVAAPAPAAPPAAAPVVAPAVPDGQPTARPAVSAKDFDRAMTPVGKGNAPATPAAPDASPATPAVGKVDENGRPHAAPGTAQAGQFLPGKTEGGVAAAPSGSGTEATATPTVGSPAEAAAPAAPGTVPDGFVRIAVPEALQRHFGREKIVPKELEEVVRFGLNNHIKNAEHETLRRQAKEGEEATVRAQVLERELLEVRALDVATERWLLTPEYKADRTENLRLQELEAEGTIAAGTAAKHWAGVQQQLRAFENKAREEQGSEVHAREAQRAEQQWNGEAWERARELPPEVTALPHFQQMFNAALRSFNSELDLGHYPDLDTLSKDKTATLDQKKVAFHNTFNRFLRNRVAEDPQVRGTFQRLRAADQQTQETRLAEQRQEASAKATRDADAARKKEAEDAALRAASNPLGSVSSGMVTRDSSGAQQKISARAFDRLMTRRL